MLQFYFTQDIFGDIGLKPTAHLNKVKKKAAREYSCKCSWDRIIAVLIFSVFTVFFWASFEQAGGSMTILQKIYARKVIWQ
jgi:POT family proton-dependent oligopeptide transporter